jgi:hypothetical protein
VIDILKSKTARWGSVLAALVLGFTGFAVTTAPAAQAGANAVIYHSRWQYTVGNLTVQCHNGSVFYVAPQTEFGCGGLGGVQWVQGPGANLRCYINGNWHQFGQQKYWPPANSWTNCRNGGG